MHGNGLVECTIFENRDDLQGENLRSLIGRQRRLCTVPFLEASLLESLEFTCCLGLFKKKVVLVVVLLLQQGLEYHSGTFIS
jgi:hypothetical protein